LLLNQSPQQLLLNQNLKLNLLQLQPDQQHPRQLVLKKSVHQPLAMLKTKKLKKWKINLKNYRTIMEFWKKKGNFISLS
jgi:hypothetical protein